MNPVTTSSSLLSKHSNTDQEKAQSIQDTTARKIPKFESTTPEGKHIAQRGVEWPNYGDPEIWDLEFEDAVTNAVDSIKKNDLKSSNIIEHFQKIRNHIARKRNNEKFNRFGLRRDLNTGDALFKNKSCYTKINRKSKAYGYALERAVKIPYDKKHFVNLISDDGRFWARKHFYGGGAIGELRYGLVHGHIDDTPIPLTQYVFCPRESDNRRYESERWFGRSDDDYIGDNQESGLWLHTGREQIPIVLEHVRNLIDKAISGDLSVIPRIHWWYVHLAPTWRGSGGIAEMLTNTLCRLHGIDLPAWKKGIAPSVEVLLEPNEEKFCSNYHLLFEQGEKKLKEVFQPELDA